MIVVDTSALVAILLGEPLARPCADALEAETNIAMSAGALAEAFIVAEGRGAGAKMRALIKGLGLEIVPVTSATAEQMGEAYRAWGKGFHRAGLNFGDCFSYALAKERGCPLLYVGDDFAQTDLASALKL